ncbi:unnamed protein product [Parnassius apollo]|uniref:(apollo) hypothetical protein n=1 Tax=Parnassius apollo TaxID=110799 RepID=A0A8S3XPG3_PARAO|nr:unnamed protein product [Parnassius apollo]
MQALQMFIDADLTQGQYEIIRKTNKKFFPCYSALQKAKKKCYPPQESCMVTSTSAEAQLQPLMDVTVRRLSEYLEEKKKIEVKPGQSVSTETQPKESDKENDQEPSRYISESDLEESEEPPQSIKADLNVISSNKKNEVLMHYKIAKQIPEERKMKFEAKYAIMKNSLNTVTTKAAQEEYLNLLINKIEVKKRRTIPQNSKQSISKQQVKTIELSKNINKYENPKDVFKKPYEVVNEQTRKINSNKKFRKRAC